MQIVRDTFYLQKLEEIIAYIAKNNIQSAIDFLDALDIKLNKLENMPYKYRQSFYYKNKKVRDFVYKGYTIPYLVDKEKDIIVILDIFKWNYRELKDL